MSSHISSFTSSMSDITLVPYSGPDPHQQKFHVMRSKNDTIGEVLLNFHYDHLHKGQIHIHWIESRNQRQGHGKEILAALLEYKITESSCPMGRYMVKYGVHLPKRVKDFELHADVAVYNRGSYWLLKKFRFEPTAEGGSHRKIKWCNNQNEHEVQVVGIEDDDWIERHKTDWSPVGGSIGGGIHMKRSGSSSSSSSSSHQQHDERYRSDRSSVAGSVGGSSHGRRSPSPRYRSGGGGYMKSSRSPSPHRRY